MSQTPNVTEMKHVVVFGMNGTLTPASLYLAPLLRRGHAVTWVTKGDTTDALRKPNVASIDATAFATDDALLDALLDAHAARPVDAVVSFIEEWVPIAARAAARFGLDLNDATTARCSTDKYAMRCALASYGVTIPRFHLVTTANEALEAAADTGYPCVLKPVRSSGSRGVKVVRNPDELLDTLRWTTGVALAETGRAEALVESYVPGPEYSAEVVVADGEVRFVGFTEKYLIGGDFRDEVGHVHPMPFDADTAAIAEATVRATVAAVGVRAGGCHVEFKLHDGHAWIMEIATRLGGALIPTLVQLATGVDLIDLTYAACLGEPLGDVRPTRARSAGIRFVSVTEPTTLHGVAVPRTVTAIPGVLRADVFARANTPITPTSSGGQRVASVVACHADRETLLDSLTRSAATLRDALFASDAPAPLRARPDAPQTVEIP